MFKKYLYHNYRVFSGTKFWLARRFSKTSWLIFGALFVAAALGADTTLSVAYQVFSFLVALVIVAAITVPFGRIQVSAERILPRFGSAGEKISYRLLVRNPRAQGVSGLELVDELADPRPTFEEFISTPEPGEEKRNWYDRTYGYYRWRWLVDQNQQAFPESCPVPPLPPRGHREIKLELTPRRRGVLRFAGVTVASPDAFGIFRRFKKISLPQSVLILPRRYSLPPVDLPGVMKYEPGGVALASAVGESQEFVSLRDYRPGDPLRHMHWKSWARTGKPIVKEFQDEFFVRHALILDTFTPLAQSEVFEEAVSVAASFAFTIQTQDSLLDLMFVGPQAYCFTAGRGVGHTDQMLEILASVRTCRHREFASLQQLVLDHLETVSGCICIFLAWDDDRQNLVAHLKALGLPLLVCVIVEAGKSTELDPGPLRNEPQTFHVLEVGRIEEGLVLL